MVSDEQLVARCLEGDQEAFRGILERYRAYVFAIILNFISNRTEAEDIAQDVFLQIYRSLPQCRLKNVKSWIGRIAVNKAIDRKRKKALLLEEITEEKINEAAYDAGHGVSSPEDLYLKKENREKVYAVTESLPEIYARAIVKYYFEGKSYREIALEEGITIKAVESRLSRAKNLFKKRWGREDV